MHFIKVLGALAILSTSAIVSARKYNSLVCCVYDGKSNRDGWAYDASLTQATCQTNYPADGEFRNGACYGVHSELDGTDFWNNCKGTGSSGWTDSSGTKHNALYASNIGSAKYNDC